MNRQTTKKSEETRLRILEAALNTFRERGFEQATMREIAAAANMAVGAAYYYFPSKDAIVMAFYERSQAEMSAAVQKALEGSSSFEDRLRVIIQQKFDYFSSNRDLLTALSAHVDPQHPLSPFSVETRSIREQDVSFFERAVKGSRVQLPPSVRPYFPRLLWLYQMGLVLFWVYDRSPGQQRTAILFDSTLKLIVIGLRLARLPLLRSVHRISAQLLSAIYGDA